MGEGSQSPRRDRHSPPRGPRDRGDAGSDKPRANQGDSYRPGDRSNRDRDDRDRDFRRNRDRNDDRERDRDRNSDRQRDRDFDRPRDRDRDRDRPRRGRGGFKWKDERRNDDRRRDDRPYRRRSRSPRRHDDRDRDSNRQRDSRGGDAPDRKEKKPAAPVAPTGGEEMIIVHVNDRLGTKAAIPCYPSDRIKEFKIMVAARIGREPHEILLKRQGERPFKDVLTLEDYGVGNGVQLDLEVDTGD